MSAVSAPIAPPISNYDLFCNSAADVVRKVVYQEIKPYLMGELAKAQVRQPCFDNQFIASKLVRIEDVDLRIQVVFVRLIEAINEQIEKASPIPTILKVAAIATQDNDIQQKIVNAFALPYIKEMISMLDLKNKAIIDNVVSNCTEDVIATNSKTISELVLKLTEEKKTE